MLQQLFSNLNSPDSVTREDALRDVSALPLGRGSNCFKWWHGVSRLPQYLDGGAA
jgi:hypothetical protein